MVTTETDPRLSLLPTRLTTLGGTDPTWRKRVHLGGREGGSSQKKKTKKRREIKSSGGGVMKE